MYSYFAWTSANGYTRSMVTPRSINNNSSSCVYWLGMACPRIKISSNGFSNQDFVLASKAQVNQVFELLWSNFTSHASSYASSFIGATIYGIAHVGLEFL